MSNRKSLDELMTLYQSDKASWAHGYCEAYELYFSSLRDKELVLLELGVGGEDVQLGGASLLGWADYFPNAKIYGIDIHDKTSLNSDRIITFLGSQDDHNFLNNIITEIGNPDIIIDDASHINKLTIASFKILFSQLKHGGIYVIEDLSCSYRWDFGGDINLQDINLETTMNYLFSMLHNLNPVRIGNANYIDIQEFIDVKDVHFYPDIVIINKK